MKKAIILFSFLSLLLTGCTIETNNKTNNIVDNSNDNKENNSQKSNDLPINNDKKDDSTDEASNIENNISNNENEANDSNALDNNKTNETVKTNTLKSHISYNETKDLVKNPGSGFYRTYPLKLEKNGIKDDISWYNDDGFYHLRISLARFTSKMGGENIEIPEEALNALSNRLKKFDDLKATVIVRFAYDGFENHADVEPNIELILKHIEALGPIVCKYNCVEALECGLIGPWGEMHTSLMDKQEIYNQIFQKWLDSTTRISILSRKPRYVFRFLGYDINNLEDFKYENDDYKRLGVFNDGYLGTSDDTGTYLNREKETAWMEKNLITPYGGEVITPTSKLTNIPNEIHLEQFKTHLSYLNEEWDNNIVNRWKDTTITDIEGYEGYNLYNFMNNHMGYGFILNSLDSYKENDNNYIELVLNNIGYKKYLYNFKAKLTIKNNSDNSITTYSFNLDKLNNKIKYQNETNSKIYLTIEDDLGRVYKLLNENLIYENNMNYIGEIL